MSVLSDIGAHFHIACAETAIQELPVKNLTLSFALAISICFKYGNNCSISIHYPRVLAFLRDACLVHAKSVPKWRFS